MTDYGRRIVVDAAFDAVVNGIQRAIADEGLHVIARLDVRDHFWRELTHDFRRYVLIDAWSPRLAFEALRRTLDVGTVMPTRFAVYELADGETAVVAEEPLAPVAAEPQWRRDSPELATIADRESERVARVLGQIQKNANARELAATR
jgi:uncharacterized protein (DUF302 family)